MDNTPKNAKQAQKVIESLIKDKSYKEPERSSEGNILLDEENWLHKEIK
ncbi:hypothetical protein [Bacillus pumilus]|nr:hypothetical protein [Bacillus pumilus]